MVRFDRLLPVLLLAGAAGAAAAKPPVTAARTTAPMQLNCDALSTEKALDPATLRDLGPAHSLDAAAEVLTKHNVKFERTKGVMTLGTLDARALSEIEALPQGEPIVLPNGESGTAICVLRPSEDSI